MSAADKRTAAQQDRRDAYRGNDDSKHSSHVISAAERAHFRLANGDDSLSNYRMQHAATNQSVHTAIDGMLLSQSQRRSIEVEPFTTGAGYYVSRDEVARRVQAKIDVAKEQGDIYNERFRNYLEKCAEAAGLDRRQFNGYQ